MWTAICLIPSAALLIHQHRQRNRQRTEALTLADVPVIVLIGNDLEGEL